MSKTLLTSEETAIAETAERYCQEQLLPRVLRMFCFLSISPEGSLQTNGDCFP